MGDSDRLLYLPSKTFVYSTTFGSEIILYLIISGMVSFEQSLIEKMEKREWQSTMYC
jgi:hypothetical protein